MNYDHLSDDELEQKTINTMNYFLFDKYKNKPKKYFTKIYTSLFTSSNGGIKFNLKTLFTGIAGVLVIQSAFAVVQENKHLKQQISVFQEKNINTPTLPQIYAEKEIFLNTDFTKPLPELNLIFSNKNYSCLPSLETPPTLAESREPCMTTVDTSQGYNENTKNEIIKNLVNGVIKTEKEKTVRFSNNQYVITSKNI